VRALGRLLRASCFSCLNRLAYQKIGFRPKSFAFTLTVVGLLAAGTVSGLATRPATNPMSAKP
jgi:hypothetical protein